jgi:predicted ester cyclase
MKKRSWLFIAVGVLLVSAGGLGSPLFAQDTNDPEANKALLLAWWEAEAEHTYDRMDTFFTDDIVRHSVATSAIMPDIEITNLEVYTQFLKGTAAMFPDYHMVPQMLSAEGEYVAFYGIFYGTFAANGNLIEVPMVGFARFEDGKIAELWVEWDNVTWNAQMGQVPPEPVEEPISSIDDVVGIWAIHGEEWSWFMELTPDGNAYIGPKGCRANVVTCVEHGTYTVEGSQIHWLSREARYEVFVTKQGSKSVSLRFVLNGEDDYPERKESLDGQTIYPAES